MTGHGRTLVLALLLVTVPGVGARATPKGGDPIARRLLEEIRRRQPPPYGLPDGWTYNYGWAQYMLAMLAAERCGYLPREETLARLEAMLEIIEPLRRYHGFSYDSYDLATGEPTSDNVYFQGWWLFTLVTLESAYPELAEPCRRMLDEVDYRAANLFHPERKQLAADYQPAEARPGNWIDLFAAPAGEMRTAYVMYTYLTGDFSPWTLRQEPRLVDIEGHQTLSVWHNFVFCPMLVHSVFPDLGYFEKSWGELLAGLEKYRERHGMRFLPTRAESLEAWRTTHPAGWPNTEHRIAKPWLAWYVDADAPVMEYAWLPDHGITLYYDNMNCYWSYGETLTPCPEVLGGDDGGAYTLEFPALPPRDLASCPHPPGLTSLTLEVARRGTNGPCAPLQVTLNGEALCRFEPEEIGTEPTRLYRRFEHAPVQAGTNRLHIAAASGQGPGYQLYRYDTSLIEATYLAQAGAPRRVPGPALEITIDGQHDGGENPFALLARCAVVHGYYPWHEVAEDESFLARMITWVGPYCARASLARVVHNTSPAEVTVAYERPATWHDAEGIVVSDITQGESNTVPCTVSAGEVNWTAEAWHTYRVAYRTPAE